MTVKRQQVSVVSTKSADFQGKSKRKVTVVDSEESKSFSSEEFSDADVCDEEDYEQNQDEFESGSENDAEPAANNSDNATNKKSKAESRNEAKKVKLERQAHRPHNELVQNAKKLWERARRRDIKAEERSGPLGELFALLKGTFKDVLAKHDASRMMQTCVKWGSLEQRLMIANELKGAYVAISKSRYGKHIVKRLLQYCPSMRKSIVAEFRGHVGKLIRHKDASMVLEEIYSDYANGRERNALLMEFYGPEYTLFGLTEGSIASLEEILQTKLQKGDVAGRDKVLKCLRESLDALVNKGSLQHTLIHRLMQEYCQHEEATRLQDWISTVDLKLVEVLHTFEGARAAARCLAVATAKQRKVILKSFKPFALKIAREEYGHQVLLVACRVVDDTVLLKSTIVSELLKEDIFASQVLADGYASKVILYLLSGSASAAGLSSQATKLLNEAEAISTALGTSKKEAKARSDELQSDLLEPMAVALTEERISTGLKDGHWSAIILEGLLLLPKVEEVFENNYFASLNRYEQADFRGFMKRFARRCSMEHADRFIKCLQDRDVMPGMIESEAAYVLITLVSTKPELKARIPRIATDNEHAAALFRQLE